MAGSVCTAPLSLSDHLHTHPSSLQHGKT